MKMKLPLLASAGALAMAAMGSANAALDPAVATTLTAIQADGTSLIGLVWPVFAAIAGGFVIFKLVKRGISKI
jgi:hypothetical protein